MKKILFFTVILASVLIINNLVHSIYTLWQKQELVIKAQKQLETKRKENIELKKKLSVAKTERFVEEEARNKLFLGKPGESEVLIQKDLIKAKKEEQKAQSQDPNWKKWWDLFFLLRG